LYYGGDVAAPVFSRVVGGALRLMAVAPDAPIDAVEDGLLDDAPLPLPPPETSAPATPPALQATTPAGGVRR
jgi:hypothetical protein